MIIKNINFTFLASVLRKHTYNVLRSFGSSDLNVCLVSHKEYVKKEDIFIPKKGNLPELKELTDTQLQEWIKTNDTFIRQHNILVLRGLYYDGEPIIIAEKTKGEPTILPIMPIPLKVPVEPQTLVPITIRQVALKIDMSKYKEVCLKCEAYYEHNQLCRIAETNINNLSKTKCPIDKWI